MKVALVCFYVLDSTIPLARNLSLLGVDTNLYSVLPYNNQNTYVFDFLNNKQSIGFVDKTIVKKTLGKKLGDYLKNVKTKVFIYPDRRFQMLFLIDLYYAFRLAKHLKKEKYDLIHIFHTYKRFWFFLYFLGGKEKVIQTLHEVTSHEADTPLSTKWILKLLIKNSTPIIFNSEISKERFLDFKATATGNNYAKDNLIVIRFGLYESFLCFKDESMRKPNDSKLKILNFGRIVPSKGINLLIDAVKVLQETYSIHLTVAGDGDPYFNFDGIESYRFINRFISNEEIVNLIEECDIVVLPYISASQSGIPMTVYCFNKPIIASNVGGFKEVIENLKTGILVDNLNVQSFTSAIKMVLENRSLLEEMGKNIEQKYKDGEFSWPFIADKTIDFYKKHLIQSGMREIGNNDTTRIKNQLSNFKE